jgi:predicted nucleotidyltransferase
MNTFEFLSKNRENIITISSKHKASNIRVFGSVARKDENETSDVDFLVTFDSKSTLFDKIELIEDLENLLNRKVDIVSDKAIHKYLKEKIISEAKML